jgi:hypothetical protein
MNGVRVDASFSGLTSLGSTFLGWDVHCYGVWVAVWLGRRHHLRLVCVVVQILTDKILHVQSARSEDTFKID